MLRQTASPSTRVRRFGGVAAAAILIVFGVAAIVQGINGRSTVRDALTQEAVHGVPGMTPAVIAGKIKGAGLTGVDLPTCSVEGKAIVNGADARCFAQYMRMGRAARHSGQDVRPDAALWHQFHARTCGVCEPRRSIGPSARPRAGGKSVELGIVHLVR